MKVLFMGRKQVAADCLEWLAQQPGVEIVGVLTDSDVAGSSTAEQARRLGLRLIDHDTASQELESGSLPCDLAVSVLYWRRLKRTFLNVPSHGAINFHPAPLPEYKGTAGYNLAILEALSDWGVSAHYMNERIDEGAIVEVRRFPIDSNTVTVRALEVRCADEMRQLFIDTLDRVLAGETPLPTHPNVGGKYVSRTEMEAMKELRPGDDVRRKIRAFWYPPYRGAYMKIAGEKFTLVSDEILGTLGAAGSKSPLGARDCREARTLNRTDTEPTRIHLSPPHMSGSEQAFVDTAFASNWIAPVGPDVDAFESEFSEVVGSSHAVALSSGTAAIHLALLLHGIGPGDDVLVSTFTFSASVNPIRYVGATPVFIDSEVRSWNMDPEILATALEERARAGHRTAAVIAVHLYGQSADLDPILEVCTRHGVPLIEDAAEALGSSYRGRYPGTHGTIGIFSFNGNKIITTSGGGMLVTESEGFARQARNLAAQARDPGPHYEHSQIGYNYRMSNLLAAVGRAQLQVLEDRVVARRQVFERYVAALGELPGLSFQPEAPWGRHTRWLTCVLVDPDVFGADRERIRIALDARNIEARPLWKPMHLQPVFQGVPVYGGSVSETLFERGLCLPSGSGLTAYQQDRVIDCIRELCCE